MTEISAPTPRTSDGKAIYLPCLFPGGVYLQFLGGCDSTQNGRGMGDLCTVQKAGEGLVLHNLTLVDPVYEASATVMFEGAKLGDWLAFEIIAPATPTTPNASGIGNCNLVDTGTPGVKLIIPAAGDGAYDVDLTKAVPIPAFPDEGESGNGFWEWSGDMVGKGTVTPGVPQKAPWNLLNVEIILVRHARIPLLGQGILYFEIPAIKTKKILPQWIGRTKLYNCGHPEEVRVAFFFAVARVQTV